MNLATKIVCRTLGTAGICAAVYDSAKVAKHFSKTGSGQAQSQYLQNAYYNSRTADKVSYSSNSIREKTFELRSKNPIPGIYGKIKGGFQGFMYGLGNYLPLIAFSTMALTCKNFFAKAGAIGIGAAFLYKIVRDGFGLGKNNPMR